MKNLTLEDITFFESLSTNQDTVDALCEGITGENMKSFSSVESLMEDLES